MALDFHGGVAPTEKTLFADRETERIGNCSAVCFRVPAGCACSEKCAEGEAVLRGDLIAVIGGTPYYSPVSGEYRGIKTIAGEKHAVVLSDGRNAEIRRFSPETRDIRAISPAEIAGLARRYGIIDPRTGAPLWQMLGQVGENAKRLIIDCTEPDGLSAITARVCLEKADSVAGGVKILLRACGAQKAVIAAADNPHGRAAAEKITARLDGFPAVAAILREKYPFDDGVLRRAIYLKDLEKGASAAEKGYLAVSPETAAAIYDCMATGFPQVDRYLGLYGNGLREQGNFIVPNGITLRDLIRDRGAAEKAVFLTNSSLNGARFPGAVGGGARAVIAVIPREVKRRDCIGCGECVKVCPARLVPTDALYGGSRDIKNYCVSCGACAFVCPSGIPLDIIIERLKAERTEAAE